MVCLGHFAIPVRNVTRSREWYVKNFGLAVEIDVPDRKTVGLKDDGDVTLFLEEVAGTSCRRASSRSKSPTWRRGTGSCSREA
jgi:catechol 2,3-dioxygenase-like lactoylglutathione lyase family enzyme